MRANTALLFFSFFSLSKSSLILSSIHPLLNILLISRFPPRPPHNPSFCLSLHCFPSQESLWFLSSFLSFSTTINSSQMPLLLHLSVIFIPLPPFSLPSSSLSQHCLFLLMAPSSDVNHLSHPCIYGIITSFSLFLFQYYSSKFELQVHHYSKRLLCRFLHERKNRFFWIMNHPMKLLFELKVFFFLLMLLNGYSQSFWIYFARGSKKLSRPWCFFFWFRTWICTYWFFFNLTHREILVGCRGLYVSSLGEKVWFHEMAQ